MSLRFSRMLGRGALAAFAIACVAGWTAPSRAVPLSFVLTGDDSASWVLDSSPVPTGFDSNLGFWFANVGPAPFLIFLTSGNLGGLTAGDRSDNFGPNLFELTGDPLFTGGLDFPILSTGKFDLVGLDGSVSEGHHDLLTVSATPLPASWLLFLTAIGGFFGWQTSRRRTV